MAFSIRNLSVLAYANGFTLWHYKAAADDQNSIGAAGYFNDAGDVLTAGDMVLVAATDSGRILCVVPGQRDVRTAPLG